MKNANEDAHSFFHTSPVELDQIKAVFGIILKYSVGLVSSIVHGERNLVSGCIDSVFSTIFFFFLICATRHVAHASLRFSFFIQNVSKRTFSKNKRIRQHRDRFLALFGFWGRLAIVWYRFMIRARVRFPLSQRLLRNVFESVNMCSSWAALTCWQVLGGNIK